MPTLPTPYRTIRRTAAIWHEVLDEGWPVRGNGAPAALGETVRRLGSSVGNHRNIATRLDTAAALGIPVREWRDVDPQWAADQVRRYQRYDDEFAASPPKPHRSPGRRAKAAAPEPNGVRVEDPPTSDQGASTPLQLADKIVPILRRGPATIEDVARRLQVGADMAQVVIELAHARGASVALRGGLWHLDEAPPLGIQGSDYQLVSDDDGVITFAAVGDTHLGSKYAREDCLADFYDNVAHRSIGVVLHAGNWIDGEAPFNKFDLNVHGMDAQMRYLADHYPRRPGIKTWAIAGADHEGWYARREGVDVGRYAENAMREAGRDDWVNMGYMETFIDLVHKQTQQRSKLCLMHPGGGSAYAISYAPQKIVEGFDGGDKPAVLLLGHYHKASYNLIRNVHVIQTGCFQDQTVFMRQKKLAAHLAGCFVRLTLDPDTGAVVEFTTTFRNYFVRDYYRGRWSEHGPVNHAERSA